MVAIIDYGLGNLASVAKSFSAAGAETFITNNPEKIKKADKIILPGQGAFADGINNLRASGLVQLLTQEVMNRKKPFLGICLGLQLLAESGLENGHHDGLGWIRGHVVKLQSSPSLRLPHVGWDNINISKTSPMFHQIPSGTDFYFVHSYYLKPKDKEIISATCNYGQVFPVSLQNKNIFATLFHPEKSQKYGQQLIRNFLSNT
jgi:glutamine amidotransferase